MRIFGVNEANHYCSSFGRSTGVSEKSIFDYQNKYLGNKSLIIKEGTPIFQQYRDCSLREIERCLFYATSHYRRSLDLLISSSAPWAYVTLYYGSWFASNALLGMFGCSVFASKLIIDVNKGNPGQQELQLQIIGINYDSIISFYLSKDFNRTFNKYSFPSCLPGVLGTQYRLVEDLLELVYSYADQFGLNTDALDGLGLHSPRRKKVRQFIYSDKPQNLVRKTKKANVA
jgi:hypothetical protein